MFGITFALAVTLMFLLFIPAYSFTPANPFTEPVLCAKPRDLPLGARVKKSVSLVRDLFGDHRSNVF